MKAKRGNGHHHRLPFQQQWWFLVCWWLLLDARFPVICRLVSYNDRHHPREVVGEFGRQHQVHNIVLYPDKSSWCNETKIIQMVSHPGCETIKIENNVCVGTCFSYTLPRTFPSTPGYVEPYCDSCKPTNTTWKQVKLTCKEGEGEVEGETVMKYVEVIENCSCVHCEQDSSHRDPYSSAVAALALGNADDAAFLVKDNSTAAAINGNLDNLELAYNFIGEIEKPLKNKLLSEKQTKQDTFEAQTPHAGGHHPILSIFNDGTNDSDRNNTGINTSSPNNSNRNNSDIDLERFPGNTSAKNIHIGTIIAKPANETKALHAMLTKMLEESERIHLLPIRNYSSIETNLAPATSVTPLSATDVADKRTQHLAARYFLQSLESADFSFKLPNVSTISGDQDQKQQMAISADQEQGNGKVELNYAWDERRQQFVETEQYKHSPKRKSEQNWSTIMGPHHSMVLPKGASNVMYSSVVQKTEHLATENDKRGLIDEQEEIKPISPNTTALNETQHSVN